MARKQTPSFRGRPVDAQVDARPPKTPPDAKVRRHVDDPVGFEPLDDVVVAGDGHEAAWGCFIANCFGYGCGANARDGAIDEAREFVEDYERLRAGGLCQCAGEVATELFAAAKDLIGFDPGRRGAEADGGEEFGYLFDRQVVEAIDDGAILRPIEMVDERIAEGGAGDCGLATARGADDQADLPGFVERRDFDLEVLAGFCGKRQVEEAGELADSEGVVDRAFVSNGNCGHGYRVQGSGITGS